MGLGYSTTGVPGGVSSNALYQSSLDTERRRQEKERADAQAAEAASLGYQDPRQGKMSLGNLATVGRSEAVRQQLAGREEAGRLRGLTTGFGQQGVQAYGQGAHQLANAQSGIADQIGRIQNQPSAAALAMQAGTDAAARNAMAVAAAQRGNQVAAGRNAALANADMSLQSNQAAGAMAAQEMQQRLALEAQQRNQLGLLAGGQMGLGGQIQGQALGLGFGAQNAQAGRDLSGEQFYANLGLGNAEMYQRGELARMMSDEQRRQFDEQMGLQTFSAGIGAGGALLGGLIGLG